MCVYVCLFVCVAFGVQTDVSLAVKVDSNMLYAPWYYDRWNFIFSNVRVSHLKIKRKKKKVTEIVTQTVVIFV